MDLNRTIKLIPINSVFYKVQTEPSILMEMSEHFSFKVPGCHFMPAYKNKYWNGIISLCGPRNQTIYRGLIEKIKEFGKDRNYVVEVTEEKETLDEEFLKRFIKDSNLPFELRDDQYNCIKECLINKRNLVVSPTSSGKTLIIYTMVRYYYENIDKDNGGKILIIVPTLSLIAQTHSDFDEYSKNDPWCNKFATECVHKVFSGQDKQTEKPVILSTWQSLQHLHKSYFEQFKMIIVDESHSNAAKNKGTAIKNILEKCISADWRFGFTGTLNSELVNELVITGLTGPVYKSISTKELMDMNKVAQLKINCVVLKHPEEICKQLKKADYREEIEYIISNEKRNEFICKLALSLKGNTIILFQFVEKHGKILYEQIQKLNTVERKIFYCSGETVIKDRELIRSITENETNAIIVASVGTMSVGTNIKSLNNLIFASPTKSRIRVLQSIGRALRVTDQKRSATIYDLVDDFKIGKHKNYTLKHFEKRIDIYNEEQFDYTLKVLKF